jgi:hypothetical protein
MNTTPTTTTISSINNTFCFLNFILNDDWKRFGDDKEIDLYIDYISAELASLSVFRKTTGHNYEHMTDELQKQFLNRRAMLFSSLDSRMQIPETVPEVYQSEVKEFYKTVFDALHLMIECE